MKILIEFFSRPSFNGITLAVACLLYPPSNVSGGGLSSQPRPISFAATVTAYCHCGDCCGRAGQPTASGRYPQSGRTVAAPRSIPLGTRVHIEGIGWRIVEDRTSRKYDGRFDVFMNSHTEALKFGKRRLTITIIPTHRAKPD